MWIFVRRIRPPCRDRDGRIRGGDGDRGGGNDSTPVVCGAHRILEDRDDLSPGAFAAIAVWPDQVRTRAAHGTIAKGWTADDVTEADDFNRDSARNGERHFVNLPRRGRQSALDAAVQLPAVRAVNLPNDFLGIHPHDRLEWPPA